MTPNQNGFFGLGIAPVLLEKLNKLGFHTPTPIQSKGIPIAMEGKDVIGIAQTGTGKTLAFGLPVIQRLLNKPGRALILVPTRELALQVNETIVKFAPALGILSVVLIGGENAGKQLADLRRKPRILIATPGRLNDFIGQGAVKLVDVHTVVIDEADRMLDMGFLPQIEKILRLIPKERQNLLFSATMPSDIVKIAATHMHLPVRTEIAPSGTAAENVSQEIFVVHKDAKKNLLLEILKKYTGSVLLFSRTKRGAKKIAVQLREKGHSAAEIHSDRSLSQRKEALAGFKSGKYRILAATDIAARGIDVVGIELVINYDIPEDPESYVHRIGRTGRAGQTGHAISFATPDQKKDIADIERLIKTTIARSKLPGLPAMDFDRGEHRNFPPDRNVKVNKDGQAWRPKRSGERNAGGEKRKYHFYRK